MQSASTKQFYLVKIFYFWRETTDLVHSSVTTWPLDLALVKVPRWELEDWRWSWLEELPRAKLCKEWLWSNLPLELSLWSWALDEFLISLYREFDVFKMELSLPSWCLELSLVTCRCWMWESNLVSLSLLQLLTLVLFPARLVDGKVFMLPILGEFSVWNLLLRSEFALYISLAWL